PLIARDDSRRPFFHVAGTAEESSPRQRERDRAGRSRERPLSHAIAVAPSDVTALVGTRPERGPQLLVDGRLDRSADVLVDQFAERDGLKPLRPPSWLPPPRGPWWRRTVSGQSVYVHRLIHVYRIRRPDKVRRVRR